MTPEPDDIAAARKALEEADREAPLWREQREILVSGGWLSEAKGDDPQVDREHLRAALARVDELELTLLNERGEGTPPGEGWEFREPAPCGWRTADDSEFRRWHKGDVLVRRSDTPSPSWRTFRIGERSTYAFGPGYPTARAAMLAADLAISPT